MGGPPDEVVLTDPPESIGEDVAIFVAWRT